MLSKSALDLLFLEARTHRSWQTKDVTDDVLHQIYDLARLGPTSAGCSPIRIVFLRSAEEKEKLKPTLIPENVVQTLTAPVTAIFAYDLEFYELLPRLWPFSDARSWYVGNEKLIQETAFRNGTLQAAYFMLAARAMGVDCGPMSGFNNAQVDAAFFAGTPHRSNFLCNLGYGDGQRLHPRGPRLDFDETCKIL